MTATLWKPNERLVTEPPAKTWTTMATVTEYHEDTLRAAHLEAQRLGFFLDPTGECHSKAPRGMSLKRKQKMIPTVGNLSLLGIVPDAQRLVKGNLAVTAGLTRLCNLLIASGGLQAYDATHTAIGVGDTATAATVADTDLGAAQLAANRYIQTVSGANVVTGGPPTLITFSATFATGNGNFHWQEWGIAGNTASGTGGMTAPLLNHKIADLGTKTSSIAWALSVTVTFS